MDSKEKKICNELGLDSAFLNAHDIAISITSFENGTVLFSPGGSCEAFLILSRGAARVEMTTKSGRDVTLYRMKPLESCALSTSALLNNEAYYAQGVTESDMTAIVLKTPDFYKALEHSIKFTQFVLKGYAQKLSSIIHMVDRMIVRDVMSEVSDYILNHMNNKFVLSITQNEMAIDVGTAREVVGRKLKILESKGVIKSSRGLIQVVDLELLKKYIN